MTAPQGVKKRRAWLAALLSLFLPGLGQLYNRDVRLALVLMIAALVFSIPCLWLVAAVPSAIVAPVAMIVYVVIVALVLFAIVHAAIRATRVRSISLAWFNRWFVYLGLIVLMGVWQNVAPLLPISSIKSYSMPSAGMSPTLLVGDHFEARTKAFIDRLPDRGELALLTSPNYADTIFVKRIIGLPGDRVQVLEGRLYLNGTLVERAQAPDSEAPPLLLQDYPNIRVYREMLDSGASYLVSEISDSEEPDNTPEYIVPVGHVFVLGDHRDRSNDSRQTSFGFVPIALLQGKPLFIYWSPDSSRIGKVLE